MKPKAIEFKCVVCEKPFLRVDILVNNNHIRRSNIRAKKCVTCSKKCSKIRFRSQGKEHLFEKWKGIYEGTLTIQGIKEKKIIEVKNES